MTRPSFKKILTQSLKYKQVIYKNEIILTQYYRRFHCFSEQDVLFDVSYNFIDKKACQYKN